MLGQSGIAGVEVGVGLEEVYPPLHVIGLEGMPPGELGDTSPGLRRIKAIPCAARSLMHELLKQIGARLALEVADGRPAHDLAARLSR